MFDNRFLPKNVSELLPSSDIDKRVTFVVSGPRLIDSLMKGLEIDDAAREAGLSTEDAIKLMATDEFRRYVEAYINLGDISDKSVRIRITKSLLAIKIADGKLDGRRDAIDILDYIRKEQMTSKGEGGGVHVHLHAGNIPRPYERNLRNAALPNGKKEESKEEAQEDKTVILEEN